MNVVSFVDTAAWIALFYRKDPAHLAFVERFADSEAHFLTTDWVLVELLNYCSGRGPFARTAASAAVRNLQDDMRCEVVRCDVEVFDASLELYEQRVDKGWSLTDCSSMYLMRERGLDRILTLDHHVTQAGFTVLPEHAP